MVNESIRKNKSILIQEKVEINTHDLDIIVNTDSKWMVFILNQLIQNSVKYRKKELQVKNEGKPIPKEEQEKIFERFYRVDKARNRNEKRYGLGLAIAKQTVEKYKGTITVNCSEGITIFMVKL